jgi:hypothetical protein
MWRDLGGCIAHRGTATILASHYIETLGDCRLIIGKAKADEKHEDIDARRDG